MKVHLHVGAHKTATTYLQSVLAANLTALNRAGIGYVPLKEMRRGFTRRLQSLALQGLDFASFSNAFFSAHEPEERIGLLISDENIVGSCGELMKSGRLYSNAPARLELLRALLRPHRPRLFFAVRSYDTFIASAYCEALRNSREFFSFASARERIDIEQLRWPVVIARMVEALEPEDVVIWRYEDFAGNADAIIRFMAFGADLTQPAQEAVDRVSFSATAIDIMEMIADRHGPRLAGKLKRPLAEQLPKGRKHGAFDPWSASERARLRAMYEEDALRLPLTPLPLGQRRSDADAALARAASALA